MAAVTDGRENAGRGYGRRHVCVIVGARKAEGWTCMFMGANQDAYAKGAGVVVGAGSVGGWKADRAGTHRAMASANRTTTDYGRKTPEALPGRGGLFGSRKEAEEGSPHSWAGGRADPGPVQRFAAAPGAVPVIPEWYLVP